MRLTSPQRRRLLNENQQPVTDLGSAQQAYKEAYKLLTAEPANQEHKAAFKAAQSMLAWWQDKNNQPKEKQSKQHKVQDMDTEATRAWRARYEKMTPEQRKEVDDRRAAQHKKWGW